MSGKKKLFIYPLCLLFGFFGRLKAQETGPVRDILEQLAENGPEDSDWSSVTEQLTFYLDHPMDLNRAGPEQLKELMILSLLQISSLTDYIRLHGPLKDILELQAVSGFDPGVITRLKPFVTVSLPAIAPLPPEKLYQDGRHELMLRYGRTLQMQKGFTDLPGSRYLGSPERFMLRYRYEYQKTLSAGLTAEKDAGEYWLKRKSGMDHLSFHISWKGKSALHRLNAGDYSLQFGQGLALWSGFALGRGTDVTAVAAKSTGLHPYRSSGEVSYFRGIAGTFNLGTGFSFTPFFSLRNLDASIKTDSTGQATVQNIGASGLHRTPSELKNERSLQQMVYGGIWQYAGRHLEFGITGYSSRYGHRFVTGTQAYNRFAFTGHRLINTSACYSYALNSTYLFGETAYSQDGGWAFLNGVMSTISGKTSAVLLLRSYDRDYHSFFSNAVGEGAEAANERGIYLGVNYRPAPNWMFSMYGDYFQFPGLKYRISKASEGHELLSQAIFSPGKKFRLTLRYKQETKQQDPDAGNTVSGLQNVNTQSFRTDWNWQPARQAAFHQRAELNRYRKGNTPGETGYMVLQDFDYTPKTGPVSGNIRLAWFSTPSYNSRVYVYEDDVLYAGTSAAYYGRGLRYFLNLRYRFRNGLDLWGRYACYQYRGRKTIGSGLDEIRGSRKSDVKFQVRYRF